MRLLFPRLVLLGLYLLIYDVYSHKEAMDKITIATPVGNMTGFKTIVGVFKHDYEVLNFLGIPYAETTTGKSRFSKPVPKKHFSQTFDATQPGPACLQFTAFNLPPVKNVTFAEDCLVLNVYTPGNATPSAHYPVMIFIHGGGFITGISNTFKGSYMSGYGRVIVVTINYRLAELGFLSTGDANVPGNMGLWDQHLAFRWVQDNIEAFGGDKSRVTIFGVSAGSISVIYQMLYPGNKGLFHRAIAQSGTFTSPWSYTKIEQIVNNTYDLAKSFNCSISSSSSLIACLRSKTESDFNNVMNRLAVVEDRDYRWTPVVDNDFVFDDPNIILSGNSKSHKATEALEMFNSVDFIIGSNSKEGFLEWNKMAELLNIKDPKTLKTISKSAFEKVIVPFFTEQYYQEHVPQIAIDAAIFEYTDWSDVNDDYKRTKSIIDMMSHILFYVPIIRTVNLRVNNGSTNTPSTYVYKLANKPPEHFIYVPPPMDGPNVANHGDDLVHILIDEGLNSTYNPVYNVYPKVAKFMMTAWTNFAKSGNPNKPIHLEIVNATWPEYQREEHFIEITADMTSASVKQRLAPEAFQFWQYLMPTLIHG